MTLKGRKKEKNQRHMLASKRRKCANIFICKIRLIILSIFIQKTHFFRFKFKPCWFTLYQRRAENGCLVMLKKRKQNKMDTLPHTLSTDNNLGAQNSTHSPVFATFKQWFFFNKQNLKWSAKLLCVCFSIHSSWLGLWCFFDSVPL